MRHHAITCQVHSRLTFGPCLLHMAGVEVCDKLLFLQSTQLPCMLDQVDLHGLMISPIGLKTDYGPTRSRAGTLLSTTHSESLMLQTCPESLFDT